MPCSVNESRDAILFASRNACVAFLDALRNGGVFVGVFRRGCGVISADVEVVVRCLVHVPHS